MLYLPNRFPYFTIYLPIVDKAGPQVLCFGKNAGSTWGSALAWAHGICLATAELAFFVARLRLRHFLLEVTPMPDYEKLYHRMVNASEDALAALEAGHPARAREILIAAERRAEEAYLSETETTVE